MDEVAEPPIERISKEDYERRLAGLGSLFPLSPAAYDSYVLSKDENTSIETLERTLLGDAALTAEVLRVANSAFYSQGGQSIDDVAEAIGRIGFRKVGELALSLSALALLRRCNLRWLDAELIQDRCFATSIAADRICQHSEIDAPVDGVALSAFFYPLGHLVVGTIFQAEYQQLVELCLDRDVPLRDFEAQVFPENPTTALSRALAQWNLPESVWRPLQHVGESFETIAKLDHRLRSQVELIILAVFVGESAVGRHMPWETIAPFPSEILGEGGLDTATPIIERVKQDLERLAAVRSGPRG